MITDLKIADKMLCIAPDIRIWSARTVMQSEDFGDLKDNLPPSDIAKLGTKLLIDPVKLRPFAMYKSRVTSLLSRHGIPFLPGSWLVPAEKASEINMTLTQIQAEFNQAKAAFMAEYDGICTSWLNEHKEHADMLRNSMASPDYVRSRLSFGWRTFGFRMTRNSNIRGEMEHLADSVFADIAKESRVVWREVFEGRETVTQRALNPIRQLAEKLRGLSFVHPNVANATSLTQSCLEAMPAKGNIEGAHLGMVFALLTLLSNPAALEDATLRMSKGTNPEKLLIPATPAAAKPAQIPASAQRSYVVNPGLW